MGHKENKMNIHDAADYIILKVSEAGAGLSMLKLQKLAYYSEAWCWALQGRALTGSEFQAWIHGPVNRDLYDRFKDQKGLYSAATRGDIRKDFNPDTLDGDEKRHIDSVLEVYARFTGSQLETMSHEEFPWIEARKGYGPTERCEVAINPEHMKRYYSQRVSA
jgi:uncharacterized phage-associated protein